MLIDRNRLATDLFTQIMTTAQGLGEAPVEERQRVYALVTDLCFEMADAFIEHAKANHQKD